MGYAADTVFGRPKSCEGHPVGPERGTIIDYHGASVQPSKNLYRRNNFWVNTEPWKANSNSSFTKSWEI
jgi:hypothetical protein